MSVEREPLLTFLEKMLVRIFKENFIRNLEIAGFGLLFLAKKISSGLDIILATNEILALNKTLR